jgi:signal transduction histidine kinase
VKRRSLRLRLLAGSALWVGLALLIAGIAIGYMFIASVERGVQTDLAAASERLMALIDPATDGLSTAQPLPDPRYDRPFSGLYWQLDRIDPGQQKQSRSRSLWDFVLSPGAFADGTAHIVTIPGPGGTSLSAVTRQVRLTTVMGPKAYQVTLAQDRAILDAAINHFGWQLAIALAILAIVLIISAWWQVNLGLHPLQKVRSGIEAIRHGHTDYLPDAYPSELLPLVSEVNDLLRTQEKSMEFARARAADLAHGIKTPLAVLETIAEKLEKKGDMETAQLLQELSREMEDRIDYQLRLSRLHLRARSHTLRASLGDALVRAIAVLKKTRDGETLNWVLEASDALYVDIDPHDLMELVGVLLENAAEWGRTLVRVEARRSGGNAIVVISDDGPGLTDMEIGKLGERGRRLDESTKGSGLGIAIAMEITSLNNGEIAMARGPEGGLAVTLTLPLAD